MTIKEKVMITMTLVVMTITLRMVAMIREVTVHNTMQRAMLSKDHLKSLIKLIRGNTERMSKLKRMKCLVN